MNPTCNARRAALLAFAGPAAAALFGGCAGSLTGLEGASSSYNCKAPVGVRCDSVSGTYANALQGNLPSQRGAPAAAGGNGASLAPPDGLAAPAARRRGTTVPATRLTVDGQTGPADYFAAPLRSTPRILRIWIKPWEDADRDLNGESYVYVQVDDGRWLVDHAQRLARQGYSPVRLGRAPASNAAASAAGASTQAAARPPASDASDAATRPAGYPAPDAPGARAQLLRALQGVQGREADND